MSLRGKVVLVIGGTGSFGRRFVTRVLERDDPRKIIVFSRDELKQYEFSQSVSDSRLRFFLGDVRDERRLLRAFSGVEIVVHAAALKQVPACEYNPIEAVRTNVMGAENVINAAVDTGVEKVIALSTDKAVNPVNLYGATKLCAEKMFVQGNSYSPGGTRFACARYGNVVGSRGSVIPLFLRQRAEGVLTITDERMTRFWITLTQAADFIRKVLGRMEGGEIFVPRIPSTRVTDLARVIGPDCEHKIVGIRPGEKIHEGLITEDEAAYTLEGDDFFLIQPRFPWWKTPDDHGLNRVAPGFSYTSDNNSDWLTEEQISEFVAEV